MSARGLYVGIDAGGSGTRAALARADGELLATGSGGSAGHASGVAGRRRVERAVAAALQPLAARVGDQPCAVHAGVTGISIPGKREAFTAAITRWLPHASVHVSHDAAVAVVGALGGGQGVGVLAGTGSIALARSADGREARSGGYGYLLGDEGGAFWLARRAVASVMRAADGRAQATVLGERFCEYLELASVDQLPGWLYAAKHPVEQLTVLAPLVSRAAEQGDAVAADLLCQAGRALADLAAAAARKLWHDRVPANLSVVTSGRVWSAGAVLMEPFEASLRAVLPTAQRTDSQLPPVGGAVLLAMQADEVRVSAAVLARLRASPSMQSG